MPSELATTGTATGAVVTIMAMRSMVPRIRKEYIMSEWINRSGSTEGRLFEWTPFLYELEVVGGMSFINIHSRELRIYVVLKIKRKENERHKLKIDAIASRHCALGIRGKSKWCQRHAQGNT